MSSSIDPSPQDAAAAPIEAASTPLHLNVHAPSVPSPLNPDAAAQRRGMVREPREKKESLKKREITSSTSANLNTPTSASTTTTTTVHPPEKATSKSTVRKSHARNAHSSQNFAAHAYTPLRYYISPPRPADWLQPQCPPFDDTPTGYMPILSPSHPAHRNGLRTMHRAQNVRGHRYSPYIVDPLFKHKQALRATEYAPYGPHMSAEDSSRSIHFDESMTIVGNNKGWCTSRANVIAREGKFYYEVKILRGIDRQTYVPGQEPDSPLPHVRVGWARREAILEGPVGFDAYSYGITDKRCDTMFRSRPGKFALSDAKKSASSLQKLASNNTSSYTYDPQPQFEPIYEGDVVGLLITLPPLTLHSKVVTGAYNPAVDKFNSPPAYIFDTATGTTIKSAASQPPTGPSNTKDHSANSPSSLAAAEYPNIVREPYPVTFKSTTYYRHFDYQSTKPLAKYAERAPSLVVTDRPNPHHEAAPMRTLPGSRIEVWKNGVKLGVAFEDLLAFLPPASESGERTDIGSVVAGMAAASGGVAGAATAAFDVRHWLDDGSPGYYPAVSVFGGGVAQVNMGPDFWFPQVLQKENERQEQLLNDEKSGELDYSAWMKARPLSDRYTDQIAEDVVWDILDEATFYVMDGGSNFDDRGGWFVVPHDTK